LFRDVATKVEQRHAAEVKKLQTPDKPKAKKAKSKPSQSDKFVEAARELGCDEDESAFDETVKKVAKGPPHRNEEKLKGKKAPKTIELRGHREQFPQLKVKLPQSFPNRISGIDPLQTSSALAKP
jgi:hypothetical protein